MNNLKKILKIFACVVCLIYAHNLSAATTATGFWGRASRFASKVGNVVADGLDSAAIGVGRAYNNYQNNKAIRESQKNDLYQAELETTQAIKDIDELLDRHKDEAANRFDDEHLVRVKLYSFCSAIKPSDDIKAYGYMQDLPAYSDNLPNTNGKYMHTYDKDVVRNMRNKLSTFKDVIIADRKAAISKEEVEAANKEGGVASKVLETAQQMVLQRTKSDSEAKGNAAVARIYTEGFSNVIMRLASPEYIKYYGAFAVTMAVLIFALFIAYKWIIKNWGLPSLVLESDEKSAKERFMNSLRSIFSGEEEEEEEKNVLKGVVLAPEIMSQIQDLASQIANNCRRRLPMQHVLFSGPPGTGKTLVAKTLAHRVGCHFVLTSGAHISQFRDGGGVKALNELFDYVEDRYKRTGEVTLIFFDECEEVFGDRARQKNGDFRDITNLLLARTNGCNDAFVLVFATNYGHCLDAAVLSRAPKQFVFNYPAEPERYKMLLEKLDSYISNDVRVYRDPDGEEIEESLIVDAELNDNFWLALAKRMVNWSGRDIEMFIQELRTRAYTSGTNSVTSDLVRELFNIFSKTVAASRLKAEYQRKRLEKETGMQSYDESAILNAQ